MPSVRLTERAIRAASTEKVQEDWYDPSQPGFLLRLGRGGAKVFYFRYRTDEGRYSRVRLGDYPTLSLAEARERARSFKVSVDRGEDPAAERAEARDAPTVEALAAAYIERYAKRKKRSWEWDQRMLGVHVLPTLGSRKAGELRKRDVLELLEQLVASGRPVAANRVLRVLSKMFNWGIEVELVPANPCQGIRPLTQEVKRERVLSEEEIVRLWRRLDAELPVIAAAIRLLLLTGQRSNQVLRMCWADLEGGVWTIPAAWIESGSLHRVPLSALAQSIVESFRGQHAEWVLPSPRTSDGLSEKVLGHVVSRLRKDLGGEHWTPHDLRRTAATRMLALGVPELYVDRVLGHAPRSATKTHNRDSYLPEKRDALERLARWVAEIVVAPVPE